MTRPPRHIPHARRLTRLAVRALLGALCLTPACDDDASSDPPADQDPCGEVDAWALDVPKATEGGEYTVALVSSEPADLVPSTLFTWRVQVRDADGAPVDGATVSVRPFMTVHGHGTNPEEPVATPVGSDGLYDLAEINVTMPGPWEFDFRVLEPSGQPGLVQFRYCVPD